MHRSPGCSSEADLIHWKRATFRDGDELHLWRREATGSNYRDVSLSAADDDAMPDMARLREILAPARAALDAARSLRPVKGRPEQSRIAVEARARMDAAAAEAQAACSGGGEAAGSTVDQGGPPGVDLADDPLPPPFPERERADLA